MERWKFVYNRNEDSRDGRFATIQKKVITFIRSLYCFVRLLPGFQLLKLSPKLVNINCTIYNPDKNGVQSSFLHETITYQFPQLLNSKGVLLVEVKYTNGINLQKLLKIQSKLTILTSPISKGGNNYTPQSNKSNATPIPIPITSGTSSPFTPQYLSPENQKSRSSSIDNEYTDEDDKVLTIGLAREIIQELKYDIVKSLPSIKTSDGWIVYVVALLLLILLFK
jgi:hypothetical protein